MDSPKPRHDTELDPPFAAYTGDEPFIFVSYSHKDSAEVYPEIERLEKLGYRIWYDEGIVLTKRWRAHIAEALSGCDLFLVFISPRAVESVNVINEIEFALNSRKPVLAVYLAETELPPDLDLGIGGIQAATKWRVSEARYRRLVATALARYAGIRGTPPAPSSTAYLGPQVPAWVGEKWAIIVGVNAYDDPGLRNLEYGVRDAELVYSTLTTAPDGFPPDNVVLLTDSQPESSHRPTRSRLLAYLTVFFGEAAPDDTVLLYFAGHGDESQGQSILLPSDAALANPGYTGLPLEVVKEYLRQCGARKKVLIVDCCHSGMGRSVGCMGEATARGLFDGAEGLVTMASCDQGELSYEWNEKRHGAFTYFLAQGLTGEADLDRDGIVVASELNRYVWDKTRRWALQQGLRQHPKCVSAVQGDIPLVGVRGSGRLPLVGARARRGDTMTGPDGGVLVWTLPGSFDMGSDDGYDEEKPVHHVTITKGFWLGQCQVTNAQYRRFCDESGRTFPAESDQPDNHPVVHVSWEDAQAYCQYYGLRLLTEAEWEWAARGERASVYPWGDEWDVAQCCNRHNQGAGGRTFEVGHFPDGASWCRALDMAGNVMEWCSDWYARYPVGSARDPLGPIDGTYRVLRGGSWNQDATKLSFRCARRFSIDPTTRFADIGFRCARDL
jgi:formylglycine-generating enzyme required for sulfatase activity